MKTSLLVILIVIASVCFAQSPAPIEWANMNVLRAENYGLVDDIQATGVEAFGDTIIIVLGRDAGNPGWLNQVSITGNNGETWSPWYVLADTMENGHSGPDITAAVVNDAILVCGAWEPARYGFHRTTDLGWTWTLPDTTVSTMRFHDQHGDTLFCTSSGDFVTWSPDGGGTFMPQREFDPGIMSSLIISISSSSEWLHIVAVGRESLSDRMKTYYGRAPLYEGPFQDIRALNPEFHWATLAYLEFAEDGTGVMLAPYDLDSPAPLSCTIMMNTTFDDGETWSPADTLSVVQGAGFENEGIVRNEHLWLVYWFDNATFEGYTRSGAKTCFSANHGRSWYPAQQVEDDDWAWGSIKEADISPSRVALYVSCHLLNDIEGQYWLQWEGMIATDSTSPSIHSASTFPELVPVDTTLHLEALVSDNDSLWLMQLVAFNPSGDTTIIPLERNTDGLFIAHWHLPSDTTLYYYYYHAEDMWENITYFPEGGPADPFELHAGEIQPADEFIPPPSSFILSIYPNPGNSQFTITGNYLPGFRPNAVVIYDLLGREVSRLSIPPGTVDRFTIHWNATNQANQPLGSGVYFVVPESGGVYTTHRIILIR